MRDAYNHRWVQSARQRGLKPTPVFSKPPSPPCASGCAAINSRDRAASSNGPALLITSPARLPPTSNRRSSLCASACLPSALAVSSASSISPSAIVPWERIWRQHGRLRKRQRQYQRTQDLAHRKATGRVFQRFSADTKDLADIPRSCPPAQAF